MTEISLTTLSPAEEIERLKQELASAQAKIDGLTAQLEAAGGLTTQPGEERPGFMPSDALLKRLEEELERARRYDKQVSVLLLAVDGWELIRQRHTPEVAANVLRATGRMISQYMRRSDLAANFEDNSFLIVMPETGLEGARVFGERLCYAIEALQVNDERRCRLLLRASGGIVVGSRETLTRDSLLLWAQDELGRAQQAGGGSVSGA